jgi:hypothetical protein
MIDKIYTIRGMQVMLDSDLAKLYQVKVKRLNQQVKRNIQRFPKEFMFQLTSEELYNLRSQIVTSRLTPFKEVDWGGKRYLPYAFTEQGVAMLSAVLRSETAIKVSIQVMTAFVSMRRFLSENANLFARLDKVEQKQITYDKNFEKVFKAIEDKTLKPKKGIFFDGQIFEAYTFVSDIIRSANNEIILIDNYVDDTVLTMLTKRKNNVKVTILTKVSKQLSLDLKKCKDSLITIKPFDKSHDRFLILDNDQVYHFGASLKDLGKKWFAFSKFDKDIFQILENV